MNAADDIKGARLDYAVAVALGCEFKKNSIGAIHASYQKNYVGGFVTKTDIGVSMPGDIFSPSQIAEQGQWIIEKYKISTLWDEARREWSAIAPATSVLHLTGQATGPTALCAAMRAFIVMELDGQIPDNAEIST